MSRFQTTIMILISIAVLYFAREVFIPVALAGLLSMLLAGPVARLEKWRVPRALSVSICVLASVAILIGVGWIVFSQTIGLIPELQKSTDEIVQKYKSVRGAGGGTITELTTTVKKMEKAVDAPTSQPTSRPNTKPVSEPAPTVTTTETTSEHETARPASESPSWASQLFGSFGRSTEPLPRRNSADSSDDPSHPLGTKDHPVYAITVPAEQSFFDYATSYLGQLLGPLGTAGVVLIFTFFILLEREDLRDRAIRLVSQGNFSVTTTAVDDGLTRVLKFLRAQAIVNVTYGAAIALGLFVIGLVYDGHLFPRLLLWGLLAAVLRFVPYIGAWVAAAFPLLLSLALYHGFTVFIAVVVLFVFIELLSNNIMEPQLYGATTGLSTMAILVSAVFWTWLWGPIGLILSTPLTVVMMVIGRYAPPLRFMEVLLGARPAMSPAERVYQRLLACDEDEAYDVAEVALKDQSLFAAYEEVVLPALAMSENDTAEGLIADDREVDVRSGLRRLVDGLSEKAAEMRKKAAEVKSKSVDKKDAITEADAPPGSGINCAPGISGKPVRIAILPAHDEADEIAGQMLAHVLRADGYEVLNASHNALASEMIDSIVKFEPHAVLISATPPAALSHVRYLLRRLAGRLPGDRIAVAVWSARTDAASLRKRLDADTMSLSITLKETIENVQKLTETARHATVA